MATRIQVRRGTTSEWSTSNPILAAGEVGYNTTLDQIKIGDGTTAFNSLEYFPTLSDAQTFTNKTLTTPNINGSGIVFEGSTADAYETTLTVTDPTADNTITLPNKTGTVVLDADYTAKGVILVATGTGAFTPLALGSEGTNLVVDSTQSSGVKWGTPVSQGAAFSELLLVGA